MHFDGATYSPKHDKARLSAQFERVRGLMVDGIWRTLGEIATRTGFPTPSISARLRDLRKAQFGSYTVERRRVGGGLYEYRVTKGPVNVNQ